MLSLIVIAEISCSLGVLQLKRVLLNPLRIVERCIMLSSQSPVPSTACSSEVIPTTTGQTYTHMHYTNNDSICLKLDKLCIFKIIYDIHVHVWTTVYFIIFCFVFRPFIVFKIYLVMSKLRKIQSKHVTHQSCCCQWLSLIYRTSMLLLY